MNDKGLTICKNLNSLVIELYEGQETHRIWRDCNQKYRDLNPDIGDEKFHAKMVKTYQLRIGTIKSAIIYIQEVQSMLPESFDEFLKKCKPFTKEFKNRIDNLVKDVEVDLDKPLDPSED